METLVGILCSIGPHSSVFSLVCCRCSLDRTQHTVDSPCETTAQHTVEAMEHTEYSQGTKSILAGIFVCSIRPLKWSQVLSATLGVQCGVWCSLGQNMTQHNTTHYRVLGHTENVDWAWHRPQHTVEQVECFSWKKSGKNSSIGVYSMALSILSVWCGVARTTPHCGS